MTCRPSPRTFVFGLTKSRVDEGMRRLLEALWVYGIDTRYSCQHQVEDPMTQGVDMGMDLQPLNPSDDAPADEYGVIIWGRYNWAGWSWLVEHLEKWCVDCSEFSGTNDGEVISDATCKKVADAIEAHLQELDEEDREWLSSHVRMWRTCGGYAQW
jgi:hypothetical protein